MSKAKIADGKADEHLKKLTEIQAKIDGVRKALDWVDDKEKVAALDRFADILRGMDESATGAQFIVALEMALQERDIVCRSLTVQKDPAGVAIELAINEADHEASLKFLNRKIVDPKEQEIITLKTVRGRLGWLELYNKESENYGSRVSVHIEAQKLNLGGLVQVWRKDGGPNNGPRMFTLGSD